VAEQVQQDLRRANYRKRNQPGAELDWRPLSVNLEESAMLSGSFSVRIDDIVEVLEARFPGALPADLGERLA
jgi:hypothetical protein